MDIKMRSKHLLKLCCIVLFLGSAQTAYKSFDIKEHHQPIGFSNGFNSQSTSIPCSGQGLVIPSPNSCAEYWECWNGEFYAIQCDVGELFDPRPDVLWCMPANTVTCLPIRPDSECNQRSILLRKKCEKKRWLQNILQ